ncbi:MAG: hypothetical protein IKK08_11255 [Clostridia bacterium]|nr:hypothetical protein [Clostridia bacterium]
MKCPYCDRDMTSGILSTHQAKPCFVEDGRRLTFGESISGVGMLTATTSNGIVNSTPAYYCPACRKMIIDTGVEK